MFNSVPAVKHYTSRSTTMILVTLGVLPPVVVGITNINM